MTCEEVENLVPFYVAGALNGLHVAEFEAHLASCSRHAQMISELRSAAMETDQVAEVDLPPELKTRVMAAVRAGAGPSKIATPKKLAVLRHPLTLVASSAAVVLLAVAAVLWTLDLRSTKEDGVFAISLRGADGASATLFYVYGEKRGVIAAEGLPTLPAGKTYQVWAADGNGARSCGLIEDTRGSPAFGRMEGDVSRNQLVIVTIEPSGGSARPTGAVVLTSNAP